MVDIQRCVICGELRVGPHLLARVIVDFNDLLNHALYLVFWRFFMLLISHILSIALKVLFIAVLVLELLIRHLILIVLLFFDGDLILFNIISYSQIT